MIVCCFDLRFFEFSFPLLRSVFDVSFAVDIILLFVFYPLFTTRSFLRLVPFYDDTAYF